LWNYLKGPILTDLVLRTMVLAIFMLALYSTAKISEDMNNKRKEELIKRRSMEKDFKEVVTDVFDVISVYKQRTDDRQEALQNIAGRRVAEVAAKLGNFLGYSPKLCKEIFDFSTIHIDKRDNLSLTDYQDKDVLDESDFRKIREKTIVGSVIIKRLQLEKKGEDIVRAHFEKTVDKGFVKEMNLIQNNRESQVILLAQIYDILRQARNYKRELKHARAIDLIQLEFYPYFDPQIVDRFVKYSDEFEAIYYRLSQE
jgi:response regulator RpfG family c-di-GMP phosphodiesterase